jgi:tetratricopeptide (TPR) repeat protein
MILSSRVLLSAALANAAILPAALTTPDAALASEGAALALMTRGDYLRARGGLAESYPLYLRAVKEAPTNYKTHRLLGECLIGMKRFEEALIEINQALKLDGSNYKLYVDRALCYIGLGQSKKAQVDLEKAVTGTTCGTAAYTYLIGIYQEQGQLDKAINLCDVHLKREPTFYQAYEQKARLLMQKKDWAAARATLDKVIAIVPYNYLHYQLRGDVNLAAGQPRGAVADYSKALSFEPYFPSEIYISRASAYRRLGEKELEKKDLAASQIKD